MATSRPLLYAGRRAARIPTKGTLEVQYDAIGSTLPVRDVSLDGFALESPMPFVPGTEHRFSFTAYDGTPTGVDAVVAHCMATSGSGSERYLTGFAFVAESNAQRANVIKVLNTIAIALAE